MQALKVKQGGTDTTVVNPALPFDVSATLLVFGFGPAVNAPIPYTITYFFESFGPGPEGTLGAIAGNTNSGGQPSVTCTGPNGTATEFSDTSPTTTIVTVPAGFLLADQTIKLTAVASLQGGFFGAATAFVEGPIIKT
jgi:hypothetical protein